MPASPPLSVPAPAFAFAAFYENERTRALEFARRRAPRVAEDLVQDAFLRVFRHWRKVPGPARTRFLSKVLRNLVIDHYRARGRDPVPVTFAEEAEGPGPRLWPAADAPTPHEDAVRSETIGQVREAVAALPGEFRDTVVEYLEPGRTHAQMAERLGCAERTVSTRMFRARLRLRAALQRLAG